MKVSWGSWIGLGGVVLVVAAVAIPQYGDYIHRAQASDAILLLGSAKTPLAEYFAEHRKWPSKMISETQNKHTERVEITRGAGGTGELELTATLRPTADRRVAGKSVRMVTKDGGKSWLCSPGTMEAKNLTAACRN